MLTGFSRRTLMQSVNKTLLNPLNSTKIPLVTSEMKHSTYLEETLKNPYISKH